MKTIKPPEKKSKRRDGWLFVVERRASFSFTIGSLAYGLYHFFNRNILFLSDAYEVLDEVFGFIGGRYFGLIFIILSALKLYGLVADKNLFKLPMYFALLALWIILGICFLLASLEGNENAAWIYCFTISSLSTSMLTSSALPFKEGD